MSFLLRIAHTRKQMKKCMDMIARYGNISSALHHKLLFQARIT
jgi:hypothetical protein